MDQAVHFFLGANSGLGFQSLFDRFCDAREHDDLLVLKGGPGAGKSTLMRRLGAAMEERGERVEYLHCSGDPDSLDGVRVPRLRWAAVDGTAPHVVEPRYPAAVGRYVNLGQFYDVDALKVYREKIVESTDRCSRAYEQAYHALSAAKQIADSAATLAAQGLNREKLLRRTRGIIGREIRGQGSGGGETYRFLSSMTCRGNVCRFDTARTLCPRLYQLQDTYALAAPMLEEIRRAAAGKNYGMIVCPDPEQPKRIEHLLLPELGLGFVTCREGMESAGTPYRRVRVDTMVETEYCRANKAALRFSRRMVQALRQEGIEQLSWAKAVHDELESLYYPCVDFAGLDQLAEEELKRLERRL